MLDTTLRMDLGEKAKTMTSDDKNDAIYCLGHLASYSPGSYEKLKSIAFLFEGVDDDVWKTATGEVEGAAAEKKSSKAKEK